MRFIKRPLFCLVLFAWPVISLAQPAIPTGRVISVTDILNLTESLGGFLFVFGVFLAGVVVIIAGIYYVTSGSDQTKVKKAKDILKGAIVGLFIVSMVGLIIAVIRGLVANPLGFFQ